MWASLTPRLKHPLAEISWDDIGTGGSQWLRARARASGEVENLHSWAWGDDLGGGPAPGFGLAEAQKVIYQVIALGDPVEHRCDFLGVLIHIGS